MKKIFLSNIILLLLINFIIKPVWVFGIDRNVQLQVGSEHFGLYSALLSLSIVFSTFLDLGLSNYNNRELAKDFSKTKELFSSICHAKLLLSLLYMVILLLVGLLSAYSAAHLKLLALIGLIQLCNSFLAFLRSNVSALHHFKFDTFLSVLDKIIVIAVIGLMLLGAGKQSITVELFVYVQIGAYLISILIALFYLNRLKLGIQFTNKLSEMYTAMRKAFPTAILIFLMGIYLRSDSYLIEQLAGNKAHYQSGLYYAGFRVLDTFNMVGFLFSSLLLPIFSRMLAQKNDVNDILKMSANMLIPASVAISIFSAFYARQIITILYHDIDTTLPHAFAVLMLTLPLLNVMNIYSSLLTANNNISTLIKISGFSALLTLSLNIIFTPKWGYAATCYISLLSNACASVLYILFCYKKIKLQFRTKEVLHLLLFSGLLILLNYVLERQNYGTYLALSINTVVVLLMYILFKWFNYQSLIQFIAPKSRY